jgi:hypothetical protein
VQCKAVLCIAWVPFKTRYSAVCKARYSAAQHCIVQFTTEYDDVVKDSFQKYTVVGEVNEGNNRVGRRRTG